MMIFDCVINENICLSDSVYRTNCRKTIMLNFKYTLIECVVYLYYSSLDWETVAKTSYQSSCDNITFYTLHLHNFKFYLKFSNKHSDIVFFLDYVLQVLIFKHWYHYISIVWFQQLAMLQGFAWSTVWKCQKTYTKSIILKSQCVQFFFLVLHHNSLWTL